MERVGITTLSEETGLNRGVIALRLTEAGVPRSAVDKTYPAAEAYKVLNASKDPAITAGHLASGRNGSMTAETLALAMAKAEQAREQARRLRLKNDLEAGRMLDREKATKSALNVAARVRTAILAIPFKVSDQLVNVADEKAIRAILTDALRSTLRDLADDQGLLGEVLSNG